MEGRALIANGTTADRRIIGVEGYEAFLKNVPIESVNRFRQQIELNDRTGESDPAAIAAVARDLAARSPGPMASGSTSAVDPARESAFVQIPPGGRREPLWYDPKGFFVITLEREAGEIVTRHFLRDYTHEMRGHSAEAIFLGLLREELVSHLIHAGYLGAELAKAESALRLRLRYEQDRPLRSS